MLKWEWNGGGDRDLLAREGLFSDKLFARALKSYSYATVHGPV